MRFPNPLTLLVRCVLIAALATWILPAGYQRTVDSDGHTLEIRDWRSLQIGHEDPSFRRRSATTCAWTTPLRATRLIEGVFELDDL